MAAQKQALAAVFSSVPRQRTNGPLACQAPHQAKPPLSDYKAVSAGKLPPTDMLNTRVKLPLARVVLFKRYGHLYYHYTPANIYWSGVKKGTIICVSHFINKHQ
jgi:hypothetical protein